MASEGKVLLACDYSQIEMRVLAILSKDNGLLEIFKKGEDVHTSVASRVFKVKGADVTKEMRRRAKVINFGIVYGMGVTALQKSLGGTRQEAQVFYDEYLAAFPDAARFMDETIASAKRLGYTTTLFGRRRMLKDIKSRLPFVRAMAERAAMNAPIQGTAADLVKIAMQKADTALLTGRLSDDAKLLLQVHDELIYEVSEDPETLHAAAKIVSTALEGVYPDSPIPLSVTTKVGKRWGSMEEFPVS
jgi:DNA polymerase-1